MEKHQLIPKTKKKSVCLDQNLPEIKVFKASI